MASQFPWFAFANNKRSSAKYMWEKPGPFLEAFTLSQSSSLHFLLIRELRSSIQRIKIYGEIGSPCLSPLKGWNSSSYSPLNKRKTEVEEIQLRISFTVSLWKPRLNNTFLTKLHSKWSYAFSKSIFMIIYPISPFFFSKE